MKAVARCEVQACHLGLGVFATQPMRRGELVGEVRGTIVKDPGYHSDYCMDLGGALSLEPAPPFRHLNHSCHPNCELVQFGEPPRLRLYAARNIQLGQQLTIDYAWPADDAVPCRCGSIECRGYIVTSMRRPLSSSAESPF